MIAAVVAVIITVWWQSAQVDERETPGTTFSELVSAAPVPATPASSGQSVEPDTQANTVDDPVEIRFEAADETLIDATIVTEIRDKPDIVRYRFVTIDTDHLRALIRDPDPKPLRIEPFANSIYIANPYERVEYHEGPRNGIARWSGMAENIRSAQFVIGADDRVSGFLGSGNEVFVVEATAQPPYHVIREVSSGVKTF